MNKTELEVAHGDLMTEVRQYRGRGSGDDRYLPGDLPRWVLPRLESWAARLGYTVRRPAAGDMPPNALGMTSTKNCKGCGKHHPVWIDLLAGMTPVSQARTLAHELSHAVSYLLSRDGDESTQFCEVIAETAGALTCQALRVPGAASSVSWLAKVSDGNPLLLAAGKPEAIRRAAITLDAIA